MIVADQPSGFGKFGGSTFGLAVEGIGRGEEGVNVMKFWIGAARLFEAWDRLIGARLQQMHFPNPVIHDGDLGIARAEAHGVLTSGINSSMDPIISLQWPRANSADAEF